MFFTPPTNNFNPQPIIREKRCVNSISKISGVKDKLNINICESKEENKGYYNMHKYKEFIRILRKVKILIQKIEFIVSCSGDSIFNCSNDILFKFNSFVQAYNCLFRETEKIKIDNSIFHEIKNNIITNLDMLNSIGINIINNELSICSKAFNRAVKNNSPSLIYLCVEDKSVLRVLLERLNFIINNPIVLITNKEDHMFNKSNYKQGLNANECYFIDIKK